VPGTRLRFGCWRAS